MTEPTRERPEPALRALAKQARAGGAERYHAKAREQGKLFVRERLARLLDAVRPQARLVLVGDPDQLA